MRPYKLLKINRVARKTARSRTDWTASFSAEYCWAGNHGRLEKKEIKARSDEIGREEVHAPRTLLFLALYKFFLNLPVSRSIVCMLDLHLSLARWMCYGVLSVWRRLAPPVL